jgi:O-antigen/teichoic acid export membrane protein
LSESFYKNQTKNLRKNIDKALKFSISVACLTIPVLLCFGKQLGMLFYKSEEAGIYLAFAAPIILPMSVCMISTSILNSMNMEKRTLLYYTFGAIFMLASIYLLPKLLGVYALFIGLAGQFTINAIFNLVALNKKIKAKQDYLPFALKAVLFILPTCALGYALVNILQCFTGNTLTCILGGTITVAFNALFYLLFGLTPIESQSKKTNCDKHKKLQNPFKILNFSQRNNKRKRECKISRSVE